MECPRIQDPWQVILQDANYLYDLGRPDAKFVKRMKIGDSRTAPLRNFVIVRSEPAPAPGPSSSRSSSSSAAATAADAITHSALKRRQEYVEDPYFCEMCNRATLFEHKSASCACQKCGISRCHNPVDQSYREGTQLHVPYLYKRSNHFRDHLKRSQAKESTDISAEVMEAIRTELSKRFDDFEEVTPSDVRQVLKTLGLSKYYNHSVRIWTEATGQPAMHITPLQEGELLHMFELIQEPWDKHRPKGRKNMLSYSYLLNKFCSLLGYYDLADHFSLLKSREKVLLQDELWAKICKELDFEFHRSVI